MPYQTWKPFPPEAIVQARTAFDQEVIGPAGKLWWGYETDLGRISESVIVKARRLDRPKN
jgi:hypothetical protein